jgi:hypothetical protein
VELGFVELILCTPGRKVDGYARHPERNGDWDGDHPALGWHEFTLLGTVRRGESKIAALIA